MRTLDTRARRRDHLTVDAVVAAATLWGLGSMSLILPVLRASVLLARTAALLLGVEFVTLLSWSYGSESCESGCSTATSLAHAVAFRDIPLLSVALVACGVIERRRALARRQRV